MRPADFEKPLLRFLSSTLVFLASFLWAQSPPPGSPPMTGTSPRKGTETKLTPKQERGRKLLQSAQAEAAAIQPDMRTFVVWKIAEGYKPADPSKMEALLRDAFTASLSIEDIAPETGSVCADMVGCGIKMWLQREVLNAMTSVPDIEARLPQARPQVQKRVMEMLIPRLSRGQELGSSPTIDRYAGRAGRLSV